MLALLLVTTLLPAAQGADRKTVVELVEKVRRADYEGDREALKQLHAELEQFASAAELGSRVHYWRAFAMWRRALNGFNVAVDSPENGQDLERAAVEFEAALKADASFVDAKVGLISSLQNLAFVHRSDPPRITGLVDRFVPLSKEAFAAAPNNPRLLWVRGASQWYSPPERGGGQDVAIKTYLRGLDLARAQRGTIKDSLEPTWGEPELLMNLAFAHLHHAHPDPAAAERYAREALKLVPHWHYVGKILLPQILKAKSQ